MGDAARVIMCNAVISEILENNLVEKCVSFGFLGSIDTYLTKIQAQVGAVLYTEMEKLAARYPQRMQNLRGKGQG